MCLLRLNANLQALDFWDRGMLGCEYGNLSSIGRKRQQYCVRHLSIVAFERTLYGQETPTAVLGGRVMYR